MPVNSPPAANPRAVTIVSALILLVAAAVAVLIAVHGHTPGASASTSTSAQNSSVSTQPVACTGLCVTVGQSGAISGSGGNAPVAQP